MIENDDAKIMVGSVAPQPNHFGVSEDVINASIRRATNAALRERISQLEADNRSLRGSIQLIMNSCKSEERIATCANALDAGPETTVAAPPLESAAREFLKTLDIWNVMPAHIDAITRARNKLESALLQDSKIVSQQYRIDFLERALAASQDTVAALHKTAKACAISAGPVADSAAGE